MPPAPMSSMISNCGNAAVTSACEGGSLPGAVPGTFVGCAASAMRQRGHRPPAASDSAAPQTEQTFGFVGSMESLIPLPDTFDERGYTNEQTFPARGAGTRPCELLGAMMNKIT